MHLSDLSVVHASYKQLLCGATCCDFLLLYVVQ